MQNVSSRRHGTRHPNAPEIACVYIYTHRYTTYKNKDDTDGNNNSSYTNIYIIYIYGYGQIDICHRSKASTLHHTFTSEISGRAPNASRRAVLHPPCSESTSRSGNRSAFGKNTNTKPEGCISRVGGNARKGFPDFRMGSTQMIFPSRMAGNYVHRPANLGKH